MQSSEEGSSRGQTRHHPYSYSGRKLFPKAEWLFVDAPWQGVCRPLEAFHRSKHLLKDLLERASRCYERTIQTFDVLGECFEQRDALGSIDEFSEVVWS
jgi:hypothetical protein